MRKEIATFFNEIESVFISKAPFVVYRKPDEDLITAFVQRTKELHELNSYDDAGFVFAPFDPKEKTVFFPFIECDSFQSTIQEVDLLKIDEIFIEKPQFINRNKATSLKEKHISLVQSGIDFIKDKKAEKIVLSRKEILECTNLNVLSSFKKMLKAYKNAFVYLWFHPAVGLWLGATPERLLTVENDNFKTMALAGTQKYNGTTKVIWENKEKQEQQYVTEFILKNLNEFVESFEFTAPFTVRAGNLLHLRTDISGKFKSDNSLEKLINALHPTPAVCGLPKTVAATFILQNEGYERAYYSGYLGELNKNNDTSLFVNLRCMQVENNLASLYVGGGITAGSIPENEWEETVSKTEVMKRAIINFDTQGND
ncbi:MAG: isochorismate synthase [Lutibacter sp.]|nr:isochorismate synthase [Lutibacter sp.]